jgi:dephospho-CoA kinase
VTTPVWVFGYGSLVSPTSMATTIGRTPAPDDIVVGRLLGYGRRWNYGSMHLRGTWHHDGVHVEQGVVVSLGLVPAADECCNGVAVRVTAEELSALDWRERDYERTVVTEQIGAEGLPSGAVVVTYVPRTSAVERYESARDAGIAGIRQSYWELVDEAFATLGADHLDEYRRTPAPDVPVVEMTLSMLG